MTTGARDPFYNSPEWHAVRRQALIRDRYQCTVCHADVHKKGAARVDHIKPKREFPHLALHLPNLRTFCASCDNKRHAEKGHGHNNFGIAADGTPLDPNHPWNLESTGGRRLPYLTPDFDEPQERLSGHGGGFDGAGASLASWDASPSSSEPASCTRDNVDTYSAPDSSSTSDSSSSSSSD